MSEFHRVYDAKGEPICDKPKIRRRDRSGSVWSCGCGRLYRVVFTSGMDGSRWPSWERVPTELKW